MHFVKIASDGSQLPADATDHAAVLDTRTNLMWSASPSINERANRAEAGKACSELQLAGFSDWRLPTVEELFLLADRSRFDPAIDTDYFPDTESWYWTSTVDAESPSVYAWYVTFGGGYCDVNSQDARARVRAVRSVAASASQ